MTTTTKQQRAIETFRAFLERSIRQHERDAYGKQIVTFNVQSVAHDSPMLKVVAEVECAGLPPNNLLRFLDHEFWLAFIGPRGGVTISMAPDAYKQFNGKRAFNMSFDM